MIKPFPSIGRRTARQSDRCRGGRLVLVGLVIAGLAVGCGGGTPSHTWRGAAVDPPTPAPVLVGTNWDGERLALGELENQVRIVFFGYTFCPDVCPFALAKMKQVYRALGERADEVSVVFVSVDPKRDSIDKLARYVPGFDERFYGLHLDTDELDQAADRFGVTIRYGRPPDGGDGSRYLVDHTGTFFIIDRAGQLRVTFPPNADADEMVPDLDYLLSENVGA